MLTFCIVVHLGFRLHSSLGGYVSSAATATGAEETPTEGHLMIQFKILSEVQHDQF